MITTSTNVSPSIIILAFNAASWIEEALDSVLRQKLVNTWELIVVNDGSTDATREVVRHWEGTNVLSNGQFIFIDLPENRGVSFCRNRGLDIACGKWVMFMDADDVLLDGGISAILECLEENKACDVIFSPTILTPSPIQTCLRGADFDSQPFSGKELYAFYRPNEKLNQTVDVCLAQLYSRDLLERFSLRFTEGMSFLEDGEFIARVYSVAQN